MLSIPARSLSRDGAEIELHWLSLSIGISPILPLAATLGLS
jgi:hypothetical protein